MSPTDIKNLQTQLNAKGANLKVDGILGPKTQAAMAQFMSTVQQAPTAAPVATTDQVKELQTYLNSLGANLVVDGKLGPKTTAAMNQATAAALQNNPMTKGIAQQNSPEALVSAYMNNDWSGLTDVTGKPFSKQIVDESFKKAETALAPGFKAAEQYETATIESALEGQRDQYQQFLRDEAEAFQAEKEMQDQSAADRGILFSGSRYQKLNDLRNRFENRQSDQLGASGRSIGNLARNYQYQYGNDAASKLSDFYKLGTQTFNPNVARGGVGAQSISSVYTPSKYNFQGTVPVSNKAQTQVRAAGLLANRANKIVPGGYKKQF